MSTSAAPTHHLEQRSGRSVGLAAALFFVAPLIAEFLLGNLPIKMLPALIILAPMYGGGALLIRELVRRSGRGWPSIVLLAPAYGILEEAFTTQSLFNPNYLGLHMGLLHWAWIPGLGIGAAWTVFVLNLHVVWSISASIALMEGVAGARAERPWLGRAGLAVTALLFAFGIAGSTLFSYKHDHYVSTRLQFGLSAMLIVLLVVAAFWMPRRPAANAANAAEAAPLPGWLRPEWVAGLLALLAGSALLIAPLGWSWATVWIDLGLDAAAAVFAVYCSRHRGWTLRHKVALGAGAALAYAWHAFIGQPMGGATIAARVGNVLFAAAACALIWFSWRRAARAVPHGQAAAA